ncbi:Hypothetical protein SRAE_0000064300 [Strongyloides ratti]|uniref:Uncharacterized protein n=1 Tax=Strongyloides ratti TaxID=34506 RepID=A0A090KVS3_STRRB|nr:Hypothetical protein SRAE_0000064300 [Strongyloides ratti]CEF61521.1 Hypothetical protein SRAE_0000064300 [Strongyloides ratti]
MDFLPIARCEETIQNRSLDRMKKLFDLLKDNLVTLDEVMSQKEDLDYESDEEKDSEELDLNPILNNESDDSMTKIRKCNLMRRINSKIKNKPLKNNKENRFTDIEIKDSYYKHNDLYEGYLSALKDIFVELLEEYDESFELE